MTEKSEILSWEMEEMVIHLILIIYSCIHSFISSVWNVYSVQLSISYGGDTEVEKTQDPGNSQPVKEADQGYMSKEEAHTAFCPGESEMASQKNWCRRWDWPNKPS